MVNHFDYPSSRHPAKLNVNNIIFSRLSVEGKFPEIDSGKKAEKKKKKNVNVKRIDEVEVIKRNPMLINIFRGNFNSIERQHAIVASNFIIFSNNEPGEHWFLDFNVVSYVELVLRVDTRPLSMRWLLLCMRATLLISCDVTLLPDRHGTCFHRFHFVVCGIDVWTLIVWCTVLCTFYTSWCV